MLGIWADDSDEEPEERARPSFGGSKKGRGANDSAPVGMFFFLNQIIILYHCLLI